MQEILISNNIELETGCIFKVLVSESTAFLLSFVSVFAPSLMFLVLEYYNIFPLIVKPENLTMMLH